MALKRKKVRFSELRWRGRVEEKIWYWTCELGEGWVASVTDMSGRTGRSTSYNAQAVSADEIIHDPATYTTFEDAKRAAVLLAVKQIEGNR